MQRVFSSESYSTGKTLFITDTEAHHVLKVLRLSTGEEVELFDGQGSLAIAKITDTSKKGFSVEIVSLKKNLNSNYTAVAFAIPKGQALDFIFHRCTEIGVREFIPLETEHSLHPGNWNRDRWEKVLIEVCKQCQSVFLPVLQEPMRLAEWLKTRSSGNVLLFCDEEKRVSQSPELRPNQLVDLLVGAEGGWSDSERRSIMAVGAQVLSLGKNRLRAETAAVVGLTLAKKLTGEI